MVVFYVSSPGMQHPEEAEFFAAELFGIPQQLAVMRWHSLLVPGQVISNELTQCFGDGKVGRRARCIGFGDFGQMQVVDGGLQADGLADSQSECIGGPEEGLQSQCLAGVDQLKDLGLRDHLRQRSGIVQPGLIEDLPLARAAGSIEKLDAAEQDALGARSDLLFNDLV